MTPHNAMVASRELVKAFVEHQQISIPSGEYKQRGEQVADMMIGMLDSLSKYFQKSGE